MFHVAWSIQNPSMNMKHLDKTLATCVRNICNIQILLLQHLYEMSEHVKHQHATKPHATKPSKRVALQNWCWKRMMAGQGAQRKELGSHRRAGTSRRRWRGMVSRLGDAIATALAGRASPHDNRPGSVTHRGNLPAEEWPHRERSLTAKLASTELELRVSTLDPFSFFFFNFTICQTFFSLKTVISLLNIFFKLVCYSKIL